MNMAAALECQKLHHFVPGLDLHLPTEAHFNAPMKDTGNTKSKESWT